MIEYERCIHERAWVDQASSFLDDHAFEIEDENSIKDLEGEGTLTSKDHDFFVSDLVSVAHVGGNPFGFVTDARRNLLPSIFLDIIDFNYINDSSLIHSAAE